MAAARRWSRDEAMLVFRLYCELPFGQMDHRNADVIRVAALIQRTPSSVAMKLANFAHLDPAMRDRGIRGMANVSALDREIAEQFAMNWEASVEATSAASMVTDEPETLAVLEGIPTEARVVARVRLTQSFFRRTVLASYDFTCSACAISRPALLNAGHIKPWSTDEKARTNPRSGISFCVLHDRAFDRGLITVLPSYELRVTADLMGLSAIPVARAAFSDLAGSRIRLPSKFQPHREFIEYHNVHVYKG